MFFLHLLVLLPAVLDIAGNKRGFKQVHLIKEMNKS